MISSSPSRQFATALVGAIALGSSAAITQNPLKLFQPPPPQTAQFAPQPREENPPAPSLIPAQFSPSQERETPPLPPPPVVAESPNQIQILQCNGQIAHANFRSGPSQQSPQIGIISRGENVSLTGRIQGDYYEAIAPYWQGQRRFNSGQGWIHKCWL